jgi:NMD protein affecting ribosome stability and mRNA decay
MSDSPNQTGIFCNLCDFLTPGSLDHESKITTGVCRNCNLKFAQPNREKWEKGWRPSAEEIEKFKSEIDKSVHSVLSDINNYI